MKKITPYIVLSTLLYLLTVPSLIQAKEQNSLHSPNLETIRIESTLPGEEQSQGFTKQSPAQQRESNSTPRNTENSQVQSSKTKPTFRN